MKFSIQLSADYPNKNYGGKAVYNDMIEQAKLAEKLGFDAVCITEHHLINCLMMPAPLHFAIKLAAETSSIKIITAVVVLPIHDMRILAGEIIATDIFTDHRLILGVGRGAFRYEIERMGIPMEETRDRFDESLAVLQALFNQEEVAWNGQYYQFDSLTVMPRPEKVGGVPMMMAVLNPDGIYQCAKKGFHILTTPLAGNQQLLIEQVSAFNRAKDEMGNSGKALTMNLSRLMAIAPTRQQQDDFIQKANYYYSKFDNVFTGPGQVKNGMIEPLPRQQSIDELAASLLICSESEMVDKLQPYAELGIDNLILNINFGLEQSQTLETLQRFAQNVMKHFTKKENNYANN